jgi:DNA-binding MarR family transcriptional regulator
LDLTPAWAETLVILDEGSPLTVTELGDLLVCESDHPSRLVDRMARAGLLERTALLSDRRAVHLRLTP